MTSGATLRNLIAFDSPGTEIDEGGGVNVGPFVEEFVCDAEITPRLGGETVMAARLASRQPATIRVRQDDQTARVTTSWRARDLRDGTVYAVRSIVDPFKSTPDHGRWFDVLVESGVAP